MQNRSELERVSAEPFLRIGAVSAHRVHALHGRERGLCLWSAGCALESAGPRSKVLVLALQPPVHVERVLAAPASEFAVKTACFLDVSDAVASGECGQMRVRVCRGRL